MLALPQTVQGTAGIPQGYTDSLGLDLVSEPLLTSFRGLCASAPSGLLDGGPGRVGTKEDCGGAFNSSDRAPVIHTYTLCLQGGREGGGGRGEGRE